MTVFDVFSTSKTVVFGRNHALKPCSIDESRKIMQNALVKVSNGLQEAELWPILVPICVENDLSWANMSRITNLDHIWTIYDHIWSIRKGVRSAPPSPPVQKKPARVWCKSRNILPAQCLGPGTADNWYQLGGTPARLEGRRIMFVAQLSIVHGSEVAVNG